MTKKDLQKIIKINNFHSQYCPKILNWGDKWRGLNANNNHKDFTDADKRIIRAGIKRLQADLEKAAKTFS